MKNFSRLVLLAVCLGMGLGSQARAEEQWNHTLVPLYLWAAGVSGDAGIGPVNAPVEIEFRDALDNLEATFSFHYEGNTDNWGIMADYFYLSLAPEGVLANGAPAGVDLDNTIYEFGGIYRPQAAPGVDLLFGFRVMELELAAAVGPIPKTSLVDERWNDLFVGLRKRWALGDKGGFQFRGDIGAGDSDLVWSTNLLFDYRFNQTASMIAGYRWLDYDIETGSGRDRVAYDVTYQGPVIALRFDW